MERPRATQGDFTALRSSEHCGAALFVEMKRREGGSEESRYRTQASAASARDKREAAPERTHLLSRARTEKHRLVDTANVYLLLEDVRFQGRFPLLLLLLLFIAAHRGIKILPSPVASKAPSTRAESLKIRCRYATAAAAPAPSAGAAGPAAPRGSGSSDSVAASMAEISLHLPAPTLPLRCTPAGAWQVPGKSLAGPRQAGPVCTSRARQLRSCGRTRPDNAPPPRPCRPCPA